MACIHNNSTINSAFISIDKSSMTPASNIKKLLKSVRKLFHNNAKKSLGNNMINKQMISGPVVFSTCMTEEEHQNWLNEQIEAAEWQF